MILRKPYSFLIKYFQKINILLLLLVAFVFYKDLQIYQFVKDYLATGIYNVTIDSITNYASIYAYLSFIGILAISSILAYLLHYKDKPYASYIFILIANFITFAFFLYTSHYFTYNAIEGYNLGAIRIVRDLLFISTLPYYPMLFILLIRSIGIDLKSFGFQQDKEFADINEADREEVEVQVGFDKDHYIRNIKYRLRQFKYFFLEHKVSLSIVFAFLFLLFSFNFYHYFYVENRIYKMNENFRSNNYQITVKNTYLTDKDYAGKIVSENGRYFILLDLDIENLLSLPRTFDIEKMMLFIDNEYYVPTTRFNEYFVDMGNLYDGRSLDSKQKNTYLLVYEINKPRENANFLLKYQDLNSSDSKLIRVKIKVLDISTFKTKGEYAFSEEANIPINNQESVKFQIYNSELLDSTTYRYQQCSPNSCPIYEGTVTAKEGYKILYLRGNYDNYSTQQFLNFLKKYGRLRYQKDGKLHDIDLSFAVNKNYQGNHLYLMIPNEAAEADSISFVFTIRTYQYIYQLKGEK